MADRKSFFGSRDYLNDFKLNDKGEYEYTGVLHSLDESKVKLSDVKKIESVYASLIFVLYLVCGFIRADGVMNSTYVTLPYVFGLIFSCILLYKTLSFSLSKRYPIRDYDFKSTIDKFGTYIILVLILSIATIIGEIIYLVFNGLKLYVVGTIVFIILIIFSLLISITFKRYHDTLIWSASGSIAMPKKKI